MARMWKLIRQTLNEDFETPEIEALEGNKIRLVRVRGQGNHVFIVCNSPVVSRNHCQLEFRNGDWFVTDFGSMNGTYINGEKMQPSDIKEVQNYIYVKIQDGDILGLGIDNVPSEELLDEGRVREDFFVFKFVKLMRDEDCAPPVDIVTISDSDDDIQEIQVEPKKVESTDIESDDDIVIAPKKPPEPVKISPSKTTPPVVPCVQNGSGPSKSPSATKTAVKLSRPGPASWKMKQKSLDKTSSSSNVTNVEASSSVKRKQDVSALSSEHEQKRCRLEDTKEQRPSKDVRPRSDQEQRPSKDVRPRSDQEQRPLKDVRPRNDQEQRQSKDVRPTNDQEQRPSKVLRLSNDPQPTTVKGKEDKEKESRTKEVLKPKKNYVVYSSDDDRSGDERVASPRQSSPSPDRFVEPSPQLSSNVCVSLNRTLFIDTGAVGWNETEVEALQLSFRNIKRVERQLLRRKFGSTSGENRDSTGRKVLKDVPDQQPARKSEFSRNVSYEPTLPDPPQYRDDHFDNGFDDDPEAENSLSAASYSEEEFPADDDSPSNVLNESVNDGLKTGAVEKPRFVQSILIPPSSSDPSKRRIKGNQSVSFFPPLQRKTISPKDPKIRKEQLQEIASKEKRKTALFPNTKPEHHDAPKVKYTAMSRNDKLTGDLLSDTRAKPARAAPALPKPSMPIATATSAMQMPVNRIYSGMNRDLPKPKIHQSREPQLQQPQHQSMKNVMHKDSGIQPNTATVPARSIVPHRSGPAIGCRTTIPNGKPVAKKPCIDLEQPYRDILTWNANWLEEQKNRRPPPPELLGKRSLVSTVDEYVNYDDYVEIFYPLLTIEFWRCLCSDYAGDKNHRRPYGPDGKSLACEFPVGVEKVSSEKQCPLNLNGPLMDPRLQAVSNSTTDYPWSKVLCHGFSKERNALDRQLDFGVVTLHFNLVDENGEPKLFNRKFLAFIQNGEPEIIESKTSVHKGLYEKLMQGQEPPKYKTDYTLILRMTPEEQKQLVVERAGSLRKISYVAPRLRDFKSVLTLHESPLFEKILVPSLEYPKFEPKLVLPPGPAALISTLSNKLNTVQKYVVHSVSDRILQNSEPEVMLLHGPPGTGKTTVIVGLIVQLLKGHRNSVQQAGVKLLVCTPSNTAINEIMNRLEKFLRERHSGEPMPLITRIGNDDSSRSKFSLDKMAEERCKHPSAAPSINKAITDLTGQIKKMEALIDDMVRRKQDVASLSLDLLALKKRRDDHEQDRKNVEQQSRNSRPARREIEQERKKILLEANVIFSTLGSCAGSLMQRHFGRKTRSPMEKSAITVCIIDEATQATEPESLAPLALDVKKLFLVGDPLQLPATVISQEAADKYYGLSLFTRHYTFYKRHFLNNPSPVMCLEQQYRMHPHILQWPNKHFYAGKLKTPSNVAEGRENRIRLQPYVFVNFDGEQTKTRADGKISNVDEAKLIVEILKTINSQNNLLNNSGEFPFTIGVITPYREQKREITEALRKKGSPESKIFSSMKIEVDTVDSYQGREKDILILSCVRSQGIGFLKSQNRLCVALTRARYSLIIIGKAECLSGDPMWKKLIDDAKERRLYREIRDDYCSSPLEGTKRGIIERAILATETKSMIAEESRLGERHTFHRRE